VHVTGVREEGDVRIAVADTGPGIAAADVSLLFLPFERLSATSGSPGTGLGLTISQRLAAAMGGRIELDSRVGRGSTFTLALPHGLHPAPGGAGDGGPAAADPGAADPAAAEGAGGGRVEVLYVEDNPSNVLLVERTLARHAGLRVEAVGTVAAALDRIRALRPSLVLLDLDLPDGDGGEVLAALRGIRPRGTCRRGRLLRRDGRRARPARRRGRDGLPHEAVRPAPAARRGPGRAGVMDGIHAMRVLAVDDQAPNVLLLERLLTTWGFTQVRTTTEPGSVLDLVGSWEPDLLLLDLQMPEPDGFAILDALAVRARPPRPAARPRPDADITADARRRALSAGASDFVSKPFDLDEVRLRVGHLLRTRRLQAELSESNRLLEERVRERTRDLERSRLEVLERLALAAEYRDDDTYRHTERVGRTTALLARRLGLPADEAALLRRAAPLHDIGKVAVPDRILLKPGRLTPEEFETMKEHTSAGARILAGSTSPLLRMAEVIAAPTTSAGTGRAIPPGWPARRSRSTAGSWRWPTSSTRSPTRARTRRRCPWRRPWRRWTG
jgi:putative two-component system response regulator